MAREGMTKDLGVEPSRARSEASRQSAAEVWSHPDGGRYEVVERGRLKHPVTGEWVDGVAYRDLNRRRNPYLLMTTAERWAERFTPLAARSPQDQRGMDGSTLNPKDTDHG